MRENLIAFTKGQNENQNMRCNRRPFINANFNIKRLDDNGKEVHRSREKSPSNYDETIISIKNKIDNLEEKFNRSFDVGVCHPGSISNETGLLKNANNSPWLNNKKFQKDISKTLNKNVICENDANCFALSEAFDGSAKNYNIVFGIMPNIKGFNSC